MSDVHPPALDLLLLAINHGWSASLVHGEDSGGSPYVTVMATRPAEPQQVRVTWHTRDNADRFRLFSALTGRNLAARDATLKAVKAAIVSVPGGPDA